jgi:hypothetical protein
MRCALQESVRYRTPGLQRQNPLNQHRVLRDYRASHESAKVEHREFATDLSLVSQRDHVDRLTRSPFARNPALEIGVLLAALDARRPTRDIDIAASALEAK